eukprot:scaffold1220_cov376-Prasinococcus_capsulatus_cf.AAC.12
MASGVASATIPLGRGEVGGAGPTPGSYDSCGSCPTSGGSPRLLGVNLAGDLHVSLPAATRDPCEPEGHCTTALDRDEVTCHGTGRPHGSPWEESKLMHSLIN